MICNNCILTEREDPKITFNDKGVCNHCVSFYYAEKQRRIEKTNWPWIVYEMKKAGKGKDYDCLLGLSGGVDSSMCLHYLIEQGLKVLAFTIDNSHNTQKSDENTMKMVETLKVPFFRYTIDVKKFRELQDCFIKSGTKNIEIPSDHLIRATAYKLARQYGIKYIISGGNMATESCMPAHFGYDPSDLKHIKGIYKKFTGKNLFGLPTMSLLQYLYYRFIKKIKVINLLDFYEYNRNKAIQLLKEKYNWKSYGEKHEESKFTKWFQNFYLIEKFGLDKRIPHYSSLINSAQMTRQEALKALEDKPKYDKIGNEEEVLEYPIKDYKDYPNSERFRNFLSKIYAIYKRK